MLFSAVAAAPKLDASSRTDIAGPAFLIARESIDQKTIVDQRDTGAAARAVIALDDAPLAGICHVKRLAMECALAWSGLAAKAMQLQELFGDRLAHSVLQQLLDKRSLYGSDRSVGVHHCSALAAGAVMDWVR